MEKYKVKKMYLLKFLKGDDGTRIRLAGKGEAGSKAAGNGDLYLFISVQNHSLFKRSEENLFFELPIGFADAALRCNN
jgi:DnaJ-class molecular chaperone with C-terminal Zn finger domain